MTVTLFLLLIIIINLVGTLFSGYIVQSLY